MIIKKFKHNNSEIIVWKKIDENLDEIKNKIINFLPANDVLFFNSIKTEKRQTEWIVSRYLLKIFLDTNQIVEVIYDENGKPYLQDTHISISHSGDYISVMNNKFNNVGIDIQFITDKTIKVAHKFLSESELNFFDLNDSTLITLLWSIKESAYKLHGIRNLAFTTGIKIKQFDYKRDNFTEVIINNRIKQNVFFIIFNNNVLSWI